MCRERQGHLKSKSQDADSRVVVVDSEQVLAFHCCNHGSGNHPRREISGFLEGFVNDVTGPAWIYNLHWLGLDSLRQIHRTPFLSLRMLVRVEVWILLGITPTPPKSLLLDNRQGEYRL